MDLSINKSLKDSLKHSFQEWYASQVRLQLASYNGDNHEPVDFQLSILKPLSAGWFIWMHFHMLSFVEAGIS